MHASLFSELSLVIVVGTLVALFMRLIRQPMIIGHILTGLLVGPTLLNLIHSPETIDVFSEFGIALLLFIVGLGLNPRIIREVGRIAAAIALAKIAVSTGVGFVLANYMGFATRDALFVGIGLSFSSTIIILKLLADKKELTRLYGKISIGFLLIEDIIATFALLVTAASSAGGLSVGDFLGLIVKFLALVVGMVIVRMVVINNMKQIIAKSQDFLFLFAIGWALGVAALFQKAGFSLEIGALLAGVVMASLPYAQEISSRLKILRDFFIVLFFIGLGSHLELSNISQLLPKAGLLSLAVLVGNPIIVMTVMGLSGYTKKTSFRTGLTGSQVSEFSLILLLLANRTGQISQEVVSLVTLVALITIAFSTYMMLYSDKLYFVFEKYLQLFERKHAKERKEKNEIYDLVLVGYQKGGHEFLDSFSQMKKRYVVIDYDPNIIDHLERHGEHCIYGDVTDPELLEEINLEKSMLVVSTISDLGTDLYLAQWLEKHNEKAVFIVTASSAVEATELYEAGASYVVLPHYIGTEKITNFLMKSGLKKSEYKKFKDKHLSYLASQASREESAERKIIGRGMLDRMLELANKTIPNKK
ncbi:cation:proton antiporter [Candidatus Saccharibacteria bacterium]|jgi:Kef-type K+ transport system membrane component KefB/voltage-gated potassium channel Kch|nr:MAG: cation:proton antiporter [Candidatus Saccharibacteria bacterium]